MVSNIVEGSSRNSDKDYNRFIEIALGSCFEVEIQLLLGKALNYGNIELIEQILQQIMEKEKMLTTFGKSLTVKG